jgi:hypothetical protein
MFSNCTEVVLQEGRAVPELQAVSSRKIRQSENLRCYDSEVSSSFLC